MEDPQDHLAATGEFSPADGSRLFAQEQQFADAGETAPMANSDSVPDSARGEQAVPQTIGRYEIKGRLGQGSMGAVYLAFDSRLHRDVALKVPKFAKADGTGPIERFYREARLAATLSHPSICPVYDIGEADGTRYIAMAYIEGRPLTDYIRSDKPQPVKHIAKTVCRVAMAVQEAHEHGVIHRDLKPDNIMIDENRKPVIMDFGLARRLFKEGEDRLTHSGALVGSPAYMSPEQVDGNPAGITSLSDIYSLGVVLYELLTGVRPFRGYVGAVMGKILHEQPQPPSELRADVDAKLESICLQMMAKDPQKRYASMDKVAHALASYVRQPQKGAAIQPAPTIELPSFRPETLESLQAKDSANPESDLTEVADESSTYKTSQSAACRTARKLIKSHDYENAVELLQQIPEDQRDSESIGLLGQARELRGLVKTLIADANRMRRNRDFYGMCRKLERLLEVKPDHQRARKLLEDLEQKGFSGVITGLSVERQAAEWILQAGGSVDVLMDGEPIQNVETINSIPDAEFRVVSCGLSGCESVNDIELANIAGLSAIHNLSLAQTTTSDTGLKHIRAFSALTSLLLAQTDITGEGLKQLSSMSQLVKLDLANTKLGDADLAMLEPLESLEFLGLLGTEITDASAPHLAQFTGLTFLDLYDTGFTVSGVTQLSKSLPNCRINF
ncbi:MAG: protein kinase [Planctomycetaceae bacterium]|nr:protein kinase [Planctomycetaceae bacterium]MBT6155051.1 protein kinase [Planctomycetaceae bacterium]MBT6486134.1 protein kinase [Planctomycetaceae bacterium]MBT6495235.1 protein kinase [Planctomycetaceae bacterium]